MKNSRFSVILVAFACCLGLAQAKKPNVVFVITDVIGATDIFPFIKPVK